MGKKHEKISRVDGDRSESSGISLKKDNFNKNHANSSVFIVKIIIIIVWIFFSASVYNSLIHI